MTGVIAIILYVFRDVVPPVSLYVWSAVLSLAYLVRYMIYLAYIRAEETRQASEHWEKYFTWSVLSSGLVWGASALYIFPENSIMHQSIILIVVVFLGVATTVTHSAYRGVSQMFVISSMLPLILRLFIEGDVGHATMAGLLLLLTFLLLATGKNLHLATYHVFDLNCENRELISQLEQRNSELEASPRCQDSCRVAGSE